MEFFELGKIIKLHGYKGELSVWLDIAAPDLIDALDFVFIEQNGSTIPFEVIKSSHKKDKSYRLKIKNINTEKEASSLVGKGIKIPLDKAEEFQSTTSLFSQLTGFSVVDMNAGALGEVFQISDSSSNPLMLIQKNYKEILIPFNEDIVLRVDQAKKEIHVQCPDGLLDLYN